MQNGTQQNHLQFEKKTFSLLTFFFCHKGYVGRDTIVEVTFSKNKDTKTVCGMQGGTMYTSFINLGISIKVKSKEELGFSADDVVEKESTYFDE